MSSPTRRSSVAVTQALEGELLPKGREVSIRASQSQGLEAALRVLPSPLRQRLGSYAQNTQRALKADWRVWYAWCADPSRHADGRARPHFPITPSVVEEFIYAHSPPVETRRDGTRVVNRRVRGPHIKSGKTLSRYLSSLRVLHREAGFKDDPTKDADVQAARRTVLRGRMHSKPKQPLRFSQLIPLFEQVTTNPWRLRDTAMLGLAYSAMLRRSELVALTVSDLHWDPDDGSATVLVGHSKADQAGHGQVRYVAPFAARALKAWLARARITTGPLFRGIRPGGAVMNAPLDARHVAEAFKRLARSLGMTKSQAAGIAGHSTRIGAAHDLVAEGFDLPGIMQSGGWSSPAMPALYTRELRAKQNAMARMIERRRGRGSGEGP